MNKEVLRAAACVISALGTVSAAQAGEPPVSIHDQQTGAAALVTGFHIVDRLSWEMVILVKLGQMKADSVLRDLNALTTPSALSAIPGGIDVPCAFSGHYNARVTGIYPRKLQVEWQDCAYEQYGVVNTYNGPARITLLSDSFAPPFVGEIRLGDASRDLVETRVLIGWPPGTPPTVLTYNSIVLGRIPIQPDPVFGEYVGSFGYYVNGFMAEEQLVVYGGDGSNRLIPVGFRLTADDVIARGTREVRPTGTETLRDLQTRFVTGAITYTYREDERRETQYQSFDRFSIRDVSSLDQGGRLSVEINGGTAYTFPEIAGTGCLNGSYRFNTVSPLRFARNPYDPQEISSGELHVNDALIAQFSASDPRLTMTIGSDIYSMDPRGYELKATAHCLF